MTVLLSNLRPFLGILVFILLLFFLSKDRKAIDWMFVLKAFALQFILAFLFFFTRADKLLEFLSKGVMSIIFVADKATNYLFGDHISNPSNGYSIIFKILPTILVFAVISSILYHWKILPVVVSLLSKILRKVLPVSGVESLVSVGNIFLGQTEAPLLAKPYLKNLNEGQILCIMTGGMATIAGGVMAAYMQLLGKGDAAATVMFGKHFLTASIISAPAALMVSKILYPDKEKLEDKTAVVGVSSNNLLEAITNGTVDGLRLAVNVGAMLLVFTALIYLVNYMLLGFGDFLGFSNFFNELSPVLVENSKPLVVDGKTVGLYGSAYTIKDGVYHVQEYGGLQFENICGWIFYPITWLIGVETQDVYRVSQMLGLKMVLNEFFAYNQLSLIQSTLHPKSVMIAIYAFCGFANFASIGIQIGGIGALEPSQKSTLTKVALLSMIGGTIACLITGAIAGILFLFC